MPPQANGERPKKLQRISQACDLCHRRSIRCRPSAENPQQQCQNCYDFAVDCTYNRPSRRRRNPSGADAPAQDPPSGKQSHQHRHAAAPLQPSSVSPTTVDSDLVPPAQQEPSHRPKPSQAVSDLTGAYATIREDRPSDPLATAWRSFALASADAINEYVHIYMEVIYPVYPLFHGPTLWERIKRKDHIKDRGCFAAIMAACALASARARDGALGIPLKFHDTPEKISEVFFVAAQDAINQDLAHAQGTEFMKACGLLALTGIQYGSVATTQRYLGQFWTLAGMQSLYDEEKWPSDLTVVDIQERRRLFWSMYNLDTYSTVVFGSMMHVQETHANVRYPSEVDDEYLAEDNSPHTDGEHWLHGQNFITDLYRILEHIVQRVRRLNPNREDRISMTRLLISDGIGDTQVMDNILGLYYQLSPRFKDYSRQCSSTKDTDHYGFMAANIQFTLQLVRMTLFSSTASSDVSQKCDVVEHVLSTFHTISPYYLRAISTPLVYQMGSIGQILASVMEGMLSEESYRRVRSGLESLADLLQEVESELQATAGASSDLRKHIEKIDAYMDAQRHLLSSVGLPPQSGMRIPQGGISYFQQRQDSRSLKDEDLESSGASRMRITHIGNSGLALNALDEFQLPQDLIDQASWPWPFDHSTLHGHDNGFPPGMHGPDNQYM